ncbi:MAG: thioredoxin family protein [Muribaculaceae bacterium]|nr:thioredoxin family protein [Muribaculaceae bacterium]
MKIFCSVPLALTLTLGFALFTSCGSKAAVKEEAAQLADAQAAEQASAEAAADEAAQVNGNAVIVLKPGESLPASSGKLMVVDFNATWCGPCRKFEPVYKAVAEKNAGKATFYSVDVDRHPALAARYRVQGIPMILFISPDGSLSAVSGYHDEASFSAIVDSVMQ